MAHGVQISVVIKALNEERRIAKAIESALSALDGMQGEVILADSHSTDKTVEIASQYPIRIARLEDPSERSCGVGAQLGFQYSRGEYVYVLDGDMELRNAFLKRALDYLLAHPKVGGVAGLVIENNLLSMEYRNRALRAPENLRPGVVDRLDGGGLYRRDAIVSLGYLTDRNLKGYEEFDLAARLRTMGWQLHRLAIPAVDHFGHDVPALQLLLRRWRTGYIFGIGQVVRAAVGQPRLFLVLRELREIWIYLGTLFWMCGILLAFFLLAWGKVGVNEVILFVAFPFALMVAKKRSFFIGIYSVTSWILHAVALVRGVLLSRKPVNETIRAKVIEREL